MSKKAQYVTKFTKIVIIKQPQLVDFKLWLITGNVTSPSAIGISKYILYFKGKNLLHSVKTCKIFQKVKQQV